MSPRTEISRPAKSKRPRPGAGKLVRSTESLGRSAAIFAALGDETRLRLVAALCAGTALSIAQLTAGTAITRQAVTKHLQVLAEVGLVHDARIGRERFWQFEPTQLDEARRALDSISRQWDVALGRLKAVLEG